jgi:hypothetical protein
MLKDNGLFTLNGRLAAASAGRTWRQRNAQAARGLPGSRSNQEACMHRIAAAILVIVCSTWTASALADCTVGIPAERLSCLNQELQALRTESSREITSLRSDIQMLRNQLLSLREIINALPPAAAIARLDEPVNVLSEEHDGCLALSGTGAAATEVFAPCAKAPSAESVIWRLRRARAAR